MPAKLSNDRIAVQHFWKLCAQYRRQFFWTWFIPAANIGSGVIVPFYIGKILGSLAQRDSDQLGLIIGLAVTGLLTVVINLISFRSYFWLQPKVMQAIHTEALETYIKRGVSFHNNRVSGKLVSDANDYASGFMQLSNTFFIDILPFAAVIVSGVLIVCFQSIFLALVLISMTVLSVGSAMYFRRRMRPFRAQRQAASREMIAHGADTIVNNQTVKTFAREDYEMERHSRLNQTLTDIRIHDWRMLANDGAWRLAGMFLFEIVFVIILILEVRRDPTLLAAGIFAFSYTVTLTTRLFQISNMLRNIEESFVMIEPMIETLSEDIEITDDPGAPDLKPGEGLVEFNDVNFRYTDGQATDPVFHELNLKIRGGEKVGLVGPSGGGKSTLTKLLLRFEDIQGGSISIDDQNIAHVTQNSLRRSIAYVAQEPLLFHRTVMENISYGKPGATHEEIIEAARKAHAHDFIMNLPDGYQTVVGERGVKLSGGQRQRVAIARAILKEAPILILDEATSALDSESEKLIQAALAELMQHKTAIVIAHRLSTIQQLDRIIVLDDGKILEEGTHKQLLAHKGLYAKLWGHQSGGFIED